MTRFRGVSAGAVLVPLVSGCASDDVKPMRVPTATDMPFHSPGENVVVHADAYASIPRQMAAFDETLTNEGVLAVEVLVVNASNDEIAGRAADARLILPNRRGFAPVSAIAVADEFNRPGNVVASAIAFGLMSHLFEFIGSSIDSLKLAITNGVGQ